MTFVNDGLFMHDFDYLQYNKYVLKNPREYNEWVINSLLLIDLEIFID